MRASEVADVKIGNERVVFLEIFNSWPLTGSPMHLTPPSKQKNVFSDRRNLLYCKSASFGCDGRLLHSPSPAAANVLSPKVLYVRIIK